MTAELATRQQAIVRRLNEIRRSRQAVQGSSFFSIGFFEPEPAPLTVVGRYFRVIGRSLAYQMHLFRALNPALGLPSPYQKQRPKSTPTEDKQLELTFGGTQPRQSR